MTATAPSALTLYLHPFAAFCQKVLIALYEHETPFTPEIIDLGDETSRARLTALWPIGRFPVLRDEARGRTVAESTVIIEYLEQHHPGRVRLLPAEPELALQMRLQDRFFDLYVAEPMQKIVTDRLRPAGRNDPHGVQQARDLL
jgi:glutathione S-transferase